MDSLTRSNVNSEQYAAPEFQKSGFNLSYSRHSSFMLGRIHIGAYQHCMPGDKIYGSNKFNGTFNRIVTPMVSPIRAMSYNFFLPYRAVDRTFEDGQTPTKNNGMSANWTAPTTSTRDIVRHLLPCYYSGEVSTVGTPLNHFGRFLQAIYDSGGHLSESSLYSLSDLATDMSETVSQILYDSNNGLVTSAIKSLTDASGSLYQQAEKMYLVDALVDIAQNISNKLGSSSNPLDGSTLVIDFFYNLLDTLLTPFIGRYSYYGELKYPYLRPTDIYRISRSIGVTNPYDASVFDTYHNFVNIFNSNQCNEYALRIMYVIWYERFRNVDLEPVSSTLPKWRDFGNHTILDASTGGNLLFLIYRIRSWEKDPFTTAQIDDLSRHVFAPVSVEYDSRVANHFNKQNNIDTNPAQVEAGDGLNGSSKPSIYTLSYRDQLSDNNVTINCPVPSNINDYLASIDVNFSDVYGLDLNTLRQSQMLEKYLKRNYLFGDEYKDRLLAHYNSRLSDMRINRPELLSQSINDYSMDQEISNVSTGYSQVGDRTATAEIRLVGDDTFSNFCEEFGMMITIVTFMPSPMYDGDDAHNSLSHQVHFPLPEFATNNEEFGRKSELSGSSIDDSMNGDAANNSYIFGRYPAYHMWRSHVDEVGGMFLDEMQDCTFRRFWGNYSRETSPKLNYSFLHCRPNLQMFANTNPYDCQLYGTLLNEFYVERVLPTPVEVI